MFKFLSKTKKETSKTESTERKPRKAIIDGKLYDTSKSTEICVFEVQEFCIERNLNPHGFAILFRTEKGNFFAQQFGHLHPIGEGLAKSILAEYPEKYIEIFGEVEEA